MGFFDQLFKKNTSTSGVTPNFVFGVEDTFQLKNSDDLIVVGRVKGMVVPGAVASLHNFTDTEDATTAVTVKGIEVDHHMVSQATDSLAGLQIENGAKQNIRIGSVLATGNISTAEVQTAYVNAIGNAYITVRNLNPSDEELERMSLTDLTEAWRLYQYHSRNTNNPDPQDVQRSKKDRIAAKLCQRLMAQDHIHLIYNKNTGEPHLFSQVVNNQDGTYRYTPPEICIITNAYLPLLREQYSTGDFEIKTISRGEDGQGIVNVLGAAFYLNGACALDINGPQVGIMAEMLVPPPSFEGIPEIQIPVMNPDLMRWILMIGQLHEPTSDDAKTIFGLYYDFLLRELPKAKLLI
ncbi:MAG: hypothetical protein J6Z06_04865, partial [Lachnospiraceae bacterium]|nr:hypothetical protein [Lachnospiraceae bacterium]